MGSLVLAVGFAAVIAYSAARIGADPGVAAVAVAGAFFGALHRGRRRR